MKLVIVESPAKAKTIEKFLGGDYKVVASYGHIRDLPGSAREVPTEYRDKSWARMAVDTEDDFTPIYVVPKESQKRVRELRKMVRKADEVLLATDEDREGESISWHLKEVLDPDVPIRRITFHEITRSAIEEALESPREIDDQLVRAQETRRILDRLYGYSLSPVLWKKVRTKLSAGRVQSVALRLVVEREEERQAFESTEYWDVKAQLAAGDLTFEADLVRIDDHSLASSRNFDSITGELDPDADVLILGRDEAEAAARGSLAAVPWTVTGVEQKETRKRPSPPFTTSTLQQAASSRLRFSPKKTMMLAQRLYEGIDLGGGDREGLITYMRTDSLHLSEKALGDAERFVKREFGDAYHQGRRRYRTKSRGAQEAHEAIRPTEMTRTPDHVARFLRKDALALYRLVWERAVASQMSDARLDRTTVEMEARIDGRPHVFRARGSVLRFPGYLKVYGGGRQDTLLPELQEGQLVGGEADEARDVNVVSTSPEQHETRPPPRYTEASLVKKLEEEGIGRPSTYTPIISTIQERDYVVKQSNYLIPTYVGMAVTHLLREHFPQYVDIGFTARMEDSLDEIAEGEVDSVGFLSGFYKGEGNGGEGLVQRIEEEMPRIDYPAVPVGEDPETGKPIEVRIGRSYIYVQRGRGDDGDRATVPVDLLIDELTPEKALELIRARRKGEEPVGRDPETGENVYVKVGPYGPYVQLGESDADEKPKRVGLPRGKDPEDVDLEYALELLSLPRVVGTDPDTGKEVTAGLGRYGPYVERDGTYRNLRSAEQIFEIGLDEAVELLNRKKGQKRVIKELGEHPESGDEVRVLDGRYGPYVTDGTTNASVPRNTDPTEVRLEDALDLLAEKKKKGGRKKRRRRKKKA